MTYHLVTPFKREHLIPFWVKEIERLGDVIYHPISEKKLPFPESDKIQPLVYEKPELPYYGVIIHALNMFIKNHKFVDDDYYVISSDDDCWETDFFDKIKHVTSDFIVVSLKRGDHQVNSPYGIDTLLAAPQNIRVGRISGNQIIMKGHILKKHQFDTREPAVSDGRFLEMLWYTYKHDDFTFVPDAYMYFNYLEPGRFDAANGVV